MYFDTDDSSDESENDKNSHIYIILGIIFVIVIIVIYYATRDDDILTSPSPKKGHIDSNNKGNIDSNCNNNQQCNTNLICNNRKCIKSTGNSKQSSSPVGGGGDTSPSPTASTSTGNSKQSSSPVGGGGDTSHSSTASLGDSKQSSSPVGGGGNSHTGNTLKNDPCAKDSDCITGLICKQPLMFNLPTWGDAFGPICIQNHSPYVEIFTLDKETQEIIKGKCKRSCTEKGVDMGCYLK